MAKDILIIVRHGPYGGFQAAEALRHANGAITLGYRPVIVLVDDGVYLAKEGHEPGDNEWLPLDGSLEEIIARGLYEIKDTPGEFYVEKDSLEKRAIGIEELVEGLELIERQKVAELTATYNLQLLF
ncbi:MAG: DsrE family protein [Deltaproteobacteria bacterium]|nr:DsrE family protein [Deltaproteobacteria bacterium]